MLHSYALYYHEWAEVICCIERKQNSQQSFPEGISLCPRKGVDDCVLVTKGLAEQPRHLVGQAVTLGLGELLWLLDGQYQGTAAPDWHRHGCYSRQSHRHAATTGLQHEAAF